MPFDPCGMVMGYVKFPYRRRAYFGGGTWADMVWYRAPEGAKVFPGVHSFGVAFYQDFYWNHADDNLGELWRGPWRWSKPFATPLTGQDFDGPKEFFRDGIPEGYSGPLLKRNRFGLPLKCLAWDGGDVTGGTFTFTTTLGFEGGDLTGGDSEFVLTIAEEGEGGDLTGGDSEFVLTVAEEGEGGDLTGGSALAHAGYVPPEAEGGDLAGGSSDFVASVAEESDGGDLAGGTSTFRIHSLDLGTGGDTPAGTSLLVTSIASAPSGGDANGNTSRLVYSRKGPGSGGSKTGGTSTFTHHP